MATTWSKIERENKKREQRKEKEQKRQERKANTSTRKDLNEMWHTWMQMVISLQWLQIPATARTKVDKPETNHLFLGKFRQEAFSVITCADRTMF